MTDADTIAREQLLKNKSVVNTLTKTKQCTDEFCTPEAQNRLRAAHVSRVHVRSGHKNKKAGPSANAIGNMTSSGKTLDIKVEDKKVKTEKGTPVVESKTQFRGVGSKNLGKAVPNSNGSVSVSSSHSNPVEASNKSKMLSRAIEEQANKR